jgi:acyl-CoA thioesterase FadM
MKISAAGHHDLKYFCFVIKLKNVHCTINYLILSQNSELLTVLNTQFLAVRREEGRKIDQEITEIGVLSEALNLL